MAALQCLRPVRLVTRAGFMPLLAALWMALSLTWAVPASASDLKADQLVEALKPKAPDAGTRTRSLRNLKVEQVSEPPPSVSLTIQFEFDSSKVSAVRVTQLEELAKAMKSSELQTLSFRVEGHTDAKGTPDYNLRLSRQRAEAVKGHLVQMGVPATRLQSEGHGDKDPANKSDRFAAENRRVRVVTLAQN